MLSAYMRFKYPNVIDAALAASAPIYMVTFEGSEREFFFSAVTQVRTYMNPFTGRTLCGLLIQMQNMRHGKKAKF